MERYRGTIIQESLVDTSILNDIEVLSTHEEQDQDNPENMWHLATVIVPQKDIAHIQSHLKRDGGWYAHFWNENNVIVIFRDKMFTLQYDDKTTWEDAIEYGISMGVPEEQLDFRIE